MPIGVNWGHAYRAPVRYHRPFVSAYSSTELFYALDGGRRRRSPELDYGAAWWLDGQRFRLSWLPDTDEVVAVRVEDGPTHRRTAPTIRIASHADGLALLMDDDGEAWAVYVVAQLDAEEIAAVFHGWRDVHGQPESLAWVAARLAAYEETRVHRGRRLIPRMVPR